MMLLPTLCLPAASTSPSHQSIYDYATFMCVGEEQQSKITAGISMLNRMERIKCLSLLIRVSSLCYQCFLPGLGGVDLCANRSFQGQKGRVHRGRSILDDFGMSLLDIIY